MKKILTLCSAIIASLIVVSAFADDLNYGGKRIKLGAEPPVAAVGDTGTLTAVLSDKAQGKTVTFSIVSGTATLQQTSAVTDANGVASVTVTLNTEGTVTFVAKLGGYPNSNVAGISVLNVAPTVTIAAVTRGTNLPNSVSPGNVVALAVTIQGGTLGDGDHVQFAVENADEATNGTAEVLAEFSTLTANGEIQLKGLVQTTPGNSGKLRIVARKNGEGPIIGASSLFSVCAHPTNFRVNGIHDNKSALRYGMIVIDRWDTDAASGDTATLNKIWERQSIERRSRDNPPWHPIVIDLGLFALVFDPELATGQIWFEGTTKAASLTYTSVLDRHRYYHGALDNPPTVAGSVIYDQHFVFACERCRAGYATSPPKVPNSDFVVSYKCFKNAKDEFVTQVVKEGNGAPSGGLKSDIEAAQAPNAPANVTVALDSGAPVDSQVFTVTWQDKSDIEEVFEVWYWDGAAWREAENSPLAPNTQQLALNFPAGTFAAGDTVKVKVRASNWRGNSAAIEAEFTLPVPEPPAPVEGGGGDAGNG